MKKSFFLASLLAATLAGCSSEEPVKNGDNGDVEANFLSVKLVTSQPGSRAAGDDDNYEDGTSTENNVDKVRFYFFYENGDAAIVKGGSSVNYAEWSPADGPGEKPNVEKTLATTLIIESPKGDRLPASVVAIVNPYNLPATSLTRDQLYGIVDNYAGSTNFVMSNAVYAEEGNKIVPVSVEGHIFNTAEDAEHSPVTIHVERVLAKVTLEIDPSLTAKAITLADGSVLLPAINSKNDTQHDFKGTDLYVKLLGWNVTATTTASRLVKEINPGWAANLFGAAEEWNYPVFFRSFWGVNPDPKDFTYTYGDFNNDGGTAANAVKSFTAGNNFAYLQENASDDFANGTNPGTPSQVIIAAQVVDKDGNVMEFAEWGFQKYALADLKTAMANNVEIFKATNPGETPLHLEKLTPADIIFKTATEMGKTEDGRYWVFAQLNGTSLEGNLYTKDGTPVTVNQANQQLANLGHAKVWTSGMTYYYFDIKHIADNGNGSKGVVRNHVYKANIKTLTGLGTPVYNPDETIIPEKPDNDDTFIAASIKILSWRIVNSDVDLDW